MRFSVDSIAVSQSSTDSGPYHGLFSWCGTGNLHYYVTLKRHENLFVKLHSLGWTIILKSKDISLMEFQIYIWTLFWHTVMLHCCLGCGSDVKDCKGELQISMIDELLLTVSKLIKAVSNHKDQHIFIHSFGTYPGICISLHFL